MKIRSLFFGTAIIGFLPYCTMAADIERNIAEMQAMDKITGRVSIIKVPVNGHTEFGSLSVVVRSCQSRPVEETPDHFAFVDITDKPLQGDVVNIFKGWMIASSPATHAVEHPIYDIWLLKCVDEEVDPSQLLSPEELAQRDLIPMQTDSNEENPPATALIKESSDITQPDKRPAIDEADLSAAVMPSEFAYDEEDGMENVEEETEPTDAPDDTSIPEEITVD